MGFAFGLFAVFAILRYRTNPIPIKEMTYLFIVITIGVINSLGGDSVQISVLIMANSILTIMAYLLENYWQKNYLVARSVTYKKIENLKVKTVYLVDDANDIYSCSSVDQSVPSEVNIWFMLF